MFRVHWIILSIVACTAMIIGCNKAAESPNSDEAKEHLRIGLIPERNLFAQLERYEPIAKYVSDSIGIPIELKALTQYTDIVDTFQSMHLDAAFLGSFAFALIHEELGVEVLARPEMSAGISTYHGLIFVRKGSNIQNALDMKGKVFAFVDRATTAGYIFPLAYFKRNGIDDMKAHLGETYFAGTHEDAINDVLSGKADIGAAKNTVYYVLSSRDGRVAEELNVLARSADVPENSLVVRRELEDTLKLQLKQALLNMHKTPEGIKVLKGFGAKRFIETTTDDYAGVYALIGEIGLDLKTYKHLDD